MTAGRSQRNSPRKCWFLDPNHFGFALREDDMSDVVEAQASDVTPPTGSSGHLFWLLDLPELWRKLCVLPWKMAVITHDTLHVHTGFCVFVDPRSRTVSLRRKQTISWKFWGPVPRVQ